MPAPLTGQAVGTGLSNPIQLNATPVQCAAFTLYAPNANTATVYIGGSTVSATVGFALDPGGELTYTRNSFQTDSRFELEPSDFYMCGATGDRVTWLASP